MSCNTVIVEIPVHTVTTVRRPMTRTEIQRYRRKIIRKIFRDLKADAKNAFSDFACRFDYIIRRVLYDAAVVSIVMSVFFSILTIAGIFAERVLGWVPLY